MVRLPPPIPKAQVLPAKLLTSQLIRHERALLLAVKRVRFVVENPSPLGQIAPLGGVVARARSFRLIIIATFSQQFHAILP